MSTTPTRPIAETQYRLETPEQIELSFDLAGPGSRFCAMAIDTLLMWLVIVALVIVAMLAGFSLMDFMDDGLGRRMGGWALALVVIAVFVITTGYYVLLETVMRGQTPGKRALALRVIREDGTGIGFVEALLRNLIRPVDFLPVFYVVGGLVCLLHDQHKRLGDLAAGTLVAKEAEPDYRPTTDRKRPQYAVRFDEGDSALTPAERQMIRSFLLRRSDLLPEARRKLARRLAATLHKTHGGVIQHDEQYLEHLLEGHRDHE